jgi:hypothetical protein
MHTPGGVCLLSKCIIYCLDCLIGFEVPTVAKQLTLCLMLHACEILYLAGVLFHY